MLKNKFVTTIEGMTVYQLKMKCKEFKIKNYSKLRKPDLIKLVKNADQERAKKEEITQIDDETIFCYPEILQEIYSYIEIDNTNETRKKLILESQEKAKFYNQMYWKYQRGNTNTKLKTLKECGITWDLNRPWKSHDEIFLLYHGYFALTHTPSTFKRLRVEYLRCWLRILNYKVPNMKKTALIEHISNLFNEINY